MDSIDRMIERFEAATAQMGRRISHCVTAAMDSDLTSAQHHILRFLARGDACRITDLAEKLRIQPSAVTAMVDRLEARGYVVRERDAEDRRIVRVAVTETGAAEYEKVEGSVRDYVRSLFSELEPEEVATLVSLFEKLSQVAARRESCPAHHPVDEAGPAGAQA